MKFFAFAALLALPLFGLGANSASADYYCCGGRDNAEHKVGWTYVVRDSVVFDCDSYECQTKIKVFADTKVKVYCRNGWCHVKNFPFENIWVLEECLKPFDGEREGYEDDGDRGYRGDRRQYRRY